MMRRLWIIPFFFLFAASIRAENIDARTRARHQLALRSAARRVIELIESAALCEGDPRIIQDALTRAMLSDPHAHRSPGSSRQAGQRLLEFLRREELENALDSIVAEAGARSPLTATKEEVLARAELDWEQKISREAARFAEELIDASFKAARRRAVARQLDEIKRDRLRPDQAALDERLNDLWHKTGAARRLAPNDLNALKDWLAGVADAEKTALFDETVAQARELVEVLLARIRREYGVQIEALDNAASVEHLKPAAIFTEDIMPTLMDAIEKAVHEAWRHSDVPPYAPFEILRVHVAEDAERLQGERLKAFLGQQAESAVSPQAVAGIVRDDLKAHVNPDRSEALTSANIAGKDAISHASAYLESAGIKHGLEQVRALIISEEMNAFWKDSVRERVRVILPQARREIARVQCEKALQELSAIGTIPDKTIKALWTATSGAEIENLEQAIEAMSLMNITVPDERIQAEWLQETHPLITTAVQELAAPAFQAQKFQLELVAAIEEEKRSRLARNVDAGVPFEDIRKQWFNTFDRRWNKQSAAAASDYPDMLALTRQALEKNIRQYYDSVRTASADAARRIAQKQNGVASADHAENEIEHHPVETADKPPDEKPEDPRQDDSARAESETEETEMPAGVDIVLYFMHDTNGLTETLVYSPATGMLRAAVPTGTGENTVNNIFSMIEPALETVLTEVKNRTSPGGIRGLFQRRANHEISIAVVVGSREIRHMTSIRLRRKVEQYLADWSAAEKQPSVALKWRDGLKD